MSEGKPAPKKNKKRYNPQPADGSSTPAGAQKAQKNKTPSLTPIIKVNNP